MKKIKVSIIIPVFNTSKYLRQCLESIVNQTLNDIEIICVDDGSTDNSLDILNEYKQRDNRIKIFAQSHKRQGAARNYGIQAARGEYIGFVDSDDWCEPDMFEKLYERAKETNSDITMCAVTTFNDNNSSEFSKSNTYANLDIFPKEFFEKAFSPSKTLDFLMNICVYPPNKIIKRNLLISNNIKFSENTYFEDGAFFFDVWLNAERISLIKHFGYYYRMHSESSTSYTNDFNKLDIFKALKDKKLTLQKKGVYKKVKKDFEAYKRKCILFWLNKISDNRVKFIYFVLTLINMPSCLSEPFSLFMKELRLLTKILFNKEQRIVFWGASIFLENFITKYHIKNENIIGIIDKNPAKYNKRIGRYVSYPPEMLKELKPNKVIISVINFSKNNKESIQEFLKEARQNDIELESI